MKKILMVEVVDFDHRWPVGTILQGQWDGRYFMASAYQKAGEPWVSIAFAVAVAGTKLKRLKGG